jgi:hypothetical protein
MKIVTITAGHPKCQRCGRRMPYPGPICLDCKGIEESQPKDEKKKSDD